MKFFPQLVLLMWGGEDGHWENGSAPKSRKKQLYQEFFTFKMVLNKFDWSYGHINHIRLKPWIWRTFYKITVCPHDVQKFFNAVGSENTSKNCEIGQNHEENSAENTQKIFKKGGKFLFFFILRRYIKKTHREVLSMYLNSL